jgi:hypothetical protein
MFATVDQTDQLQQAKLQRLLNYQRRSLRTNPNVPRSELTIMEALERLEGCDDFAAYCHTFKQSVKTVLKNGSDGLFVARGLMKLYLMLQKHTKEPSAVSRFLAEVELKVARIRQNKFKWGAHESSIAGMTRFLGLANLVRRDDYLTYLPIEGLACVYPLRLFTAFPDFPTYVAKNSNSIYQEVLCFQFALLKAFKRVYLELPMSLCIRFEFDSLACTDPFLRLEQRKHNSLVYHEVVESQHGFQLVDYLMALFQKFNFVDVPTWNFKFEPIVFEELMHAVMVAFEYGLVRVDQTEELLEHLVNACEVVNGYEQFFEAHLTKQRLKQGQAKGANGKGGNGPVQDSGENRDNADPTGKPDPLKVFQHDELSEGDDCNELLGNFPDCQQIGEDPLEPGFLDKEPFDETRVRKRFESQTSRIRFYASSILLHLLYLHFDEDVRQLWNRASEKLSLDKHDMFFNKPRLANCVSMVLFKFLTKDNKNRVTTTPADLDTDLIVAKLLSLVQGDFQKVFKKTLERTQFCHLPNEDIKSGLDSRVDRLVNDLNELEEAIIFEDFWNVKGQVASRFDSILSQVVSMSQADPSERQYLTTQTTLAGTANVFFRISQPALAVIGQDYGSSFDKVSYLMLAASSHTRKLFFSDQNFDFLLASFTRNPLLFTVLLTKVFAEDFSLFYDSTEAFTVLVSLYKKVVKQLAKVSFESGPCHIVAVTVLNHFLRDLKVKKNSSDKALELKISLVLSRLVRKLMASHVLPFFQSQSHPDPSVPLPVDPFRHTRFDFDGLSLESQRLSAVDPLALQFELFFSFLKLFNELSNDLFTHHTFSILHPHLEGSQGTLTSPKWDSCLLLRAEMLLLRTNLLLSHSDKLFFSSEIIKAGPFLNKDIFGPLELEEVQVMVREVDWLGRLLSSRAISDRQGLEGYLFKGVCPFVYRLLKALFETFLSEKAVDGSHSAFETVKRLFWQLLDLIGRALSNSTSISPGNSQSGLCFEGEKQVVGQSGTDGVADDGQRVDSCIKAHQQKLGGLKGLLSGAKNLMGMGTNSADRKEDSQVVDCGYNYQFQVDNLKEMMSVVQSLYIDKPQFSVYLDLQLNDSERKRAKVAQKASKSTSKAQRKSDRCKDQVTRHILKFGQVFFSGPDNLFSQFLSSGKNSEQIHTQLSRFLVHKIASNSIEVVPKNWTNCFLLNEGCLAYIRFFEFALRTSKAFKKTVFQVLSAKKVTKCSATGNKSKRIGRVMVLKLRTLYTLLAHFLFSKRLDDSLFKHFLSILNTVSGLFFVLTDSNPSFRDVYNTKGFGVMEEVLERNTSCEHSGTVLEEQFLVLTQFLEQTTLGTIDNPQLRSSDHSPKLELLDLLLQDCARMVSPKSSKVFKGFFTSCSETFHGVLARELTDKNSALYSFKWSIVYFFYECLQSYDLEIMSKFIDNYEPSRVFRYIFSSVKGLFQSVTNTHPSRAALVTLDHEQRMEMQELHRLSVCNALEWVEKEKFGKEVIKSPYMLVDLYQRDPRFSEHVIVKYAIDLYNVLSILASKSIFLTSVLQEREAAAQQCFTKEGFQVPGFSLHVEDNAILAFLLRVRGRVEVLVPDFSDPSGETKTLTQVFFTVRPSCFFWTDSLMHDFLQSASFLSTAENLKHFLLSINSVHEELVNNQKIRNQLWVVSKLFDGDAFHLYNVVLMGLTVLINVLIFVFEDNPTQLKDIPSPSVGLLAIDGVGWAMLGLSLFATTSFLFFRGRLLLSNQLRLFVTLKDRQPLPREWLQLVLVDCFLLNFQLSSFALFTVTSFVGLFHNKLAYSVNYLSLIYLSGDVKYILQSIIDQFDKILATLLIMMFVIIAYSFLLFRNFANEYSTDWTGTCSSLSSCFLNNFLVGFLSKLSDQLQEKTSVGSQSEFWGYFTVVLSYFLLVKLILLNIVNSIIINSFNRLREEFCHKLGQTENYCFVCNLSRWDLQEMGLSFEEHRENVHNLRAYFFFVIYLKSLNEVEENDVLESIADAVERTDHQWLPQKMVLEPGQFRRVVTKREIQESLERSDTSGSQTTDSAKTMEKNRNADTKATSQKSVTQLLDKGLDCPNCGHHLA